MISPFKYAILSKYYIYAEKVLFQINAENVTEKSAVIFKYGYINFYQNA